MKTTINKPENVQAQQANGEATTPRTGFYTNTMPVLGKTGEYVHYFLPGDVVITEHANRYKGLLGIPYTPKAQSAEKKEFTPRAGLHAKIRIGLSRDGQWVTVFLPAGMGRISNHVNAFKHIFKVPYERKARAA